MARCRLWGCPQPCRAKPSGPGPPDTHIAEPSQASIAGQRLKPRSFPRVRRLASGGSCPSITSWCDQLFFPPQLPASTSFPLLVAVAWQRTRRVSGSTGLRLHETGRGPTSARGTTGTDGRRSGDRHGLRARSPPQGPELGAVAMVSGDVELLGATGGLCERPTRSRPLLRHVVARAPGLMLENSAVAHSAAVGMVESAVRRATGKIVTLKSALEGRPESVVKAGVARHAVLLISAGQGRSPTSARR